LNVELKLIADVGLVGLPNAGKSTLLSVISAAKPKIADYPFTTLEPVLGVVSVDDSTFVVADIPGIIEGASGGAGLGLDFLRHIERTRLLIHVVDVSGEDESDPILDFDRIGNELSQYNENLLSRPRIIAANKTDRADPDQLKRFISEVRDRGFEVFPISAATKQGTDELLREVARMLPLIPKPIAVQPVREERLYTFTEQAPFSIRKEENIFIVEGDWVRSLSSSINFDDTESL
jgi:GTP-binding protein